MAAIFNARPLQSCGRSAARPNGTDPVFRDRLEVRRIDSQIWVPKKGGSLCRRGLWGRIGFWGGVVMELGGVGEVL
jgi:hypothetical protein